MRSMSQKESTAEELRLRVSTAWGIEQSPGFGPRSSQLGFSVLSPRWVLLRAKRLLFFFTKEEFRWWPAGLRPPVGGAAEALHFWRHAYFVG